jgi:hypothetical protein
MTLGPASWCLLVALESESGGAQQMDIPEGIRAFGESPIEGSSLSRPASHFTIVSKNFAGLRMSSCQDERPPPA